MEWFGDIQSKQWYEHLIREMEKEKSPEKIRIKVGFESIFTKRYDDL
jgi:hypothetical protein